MPVTQLGNLAGVTAVSGTASQSQVQSFVGTASAGTFKARLGTKQPKISYVETGALARNISAADLQTALRDLSLDGVSTIGTAITCAGGALGSNPITATWSGKYGNLTMPVFEIINVNLTGGTVTCTETTAAVVGSFVDANLASLAAMHARLTAIDGTLYSAANLAKMTYNDKMYAIRLHDESWTI